MSTSIVNDWKSDGTKTRSLLVALTTILSALRHRAYRWIDAATFILLDYTWNPLMRVLLQSSVAKSWSETQYFLDCLPGQHALTPIPDMRPVFDLHPKELEHQWHCKWEIGQISECWPIGQSDVIMLGYWESFIQNVPLFETIWVQPYRYQRWNRLTRGQSIVILSSRLG